MNEIEKKRYEELKEKNKEKSKELAWKNNVLLQECLEELGDASYILNTKESKKILDLFYKSVPISKHSRVDFEKIDLSNNIANASELLIQANNKEFYIIWDELNLPIVRSKLTNIINSIDDVIAVSFDTWLLSTNINEIIEFYHEGEINIGSI